jgi:hypothetical protein
MNDQANTPQPQRIILPLDIAAVELILKGLNELPRKESGELFDAILRVANEQMQSQAAPAEGEPVDVQEDTDAEPLSE